MAAIASLDALIEALTTDGRKHMLPIVFDSRRDTAAVTGSTGLWHMVSAQNCAPRGYMAQPAETSACWGARTSTGMPAATTHLTAGNVGQPLPGGGRQTWITGLDLIVSGIVSVLLYDRLAHLIATVNFPADTNLTSVGPVNPTRYNDVATDPAGAVQPSVGNMILLEAWVGFSGNSTNLLQIEYTNQDGVTGKLTPPRGIGGTGQYRAVLFPLAVGDTGVRAITGVKAGIAGITGTYSLAVIRSMLWLTTANNTIVSRDTISGLPSLPQVMPGACLQLLGMPNSNNAPAGWGSLHLVEA